MEKKFFFKLNGSSSQALPPSFFEVAVVCSVVDEQKAKSLAFIYLEKKNSPGPSYSSPSTVIIAPISPTIIPQ